MTTKIAVNGFGRIGRLVVRSALQRDDMEVMAINDIAEPDRMAHLFQYDSVHGTYEGEVELDGEQLKIDSQEVQLLSVQDPADLPWDELDVDIAVESTGVFRQKEEAAKHLEAGADKVVISAPGKGDLLSIVMGVNEDEYDPAEHDIVDNASCTTNCLAPMVKVLNDTFGLQSATVTTTHAYTTSQNILDGPGGKDYRRMRAAAESIIPTSTGSAVATTEVLPELEGKIDGIALRVPVPDGSITDLSATLEEDVTEEEVNDAFRQAAGGELDGIMDVEDTELVSRDYVGNPHSVVVDAEKTMVVNGNQIKVLGWYDNEWGYANRIVDLVQYMMEA